MSFGAIAATGCVCVYLCMLNLAGQFLGLSKNVPLYIHLYCY